MTTFSVEVVPTLSPGQCRNCGATNNRDWFLNMGYVEDFFGTVYYCNECVKEIASFVEQETRLPRIMALKKEIEELNDRYSGIVSVFDRLLNAGINLYAFVDFVAPESRKDEPSQRTATLEFRKTRSVEQSSESGPVRVPSDDSSSATIPGITLQ